MPYQLKSHNPGSDKQSSRKVPGTICTMIDGVAVPAMEILEQPEPSIYGHLRYCMKFKNNSKPAFTLYRQLHATSKRTYSYSCSISFRPMFQQGMSIITINTISTERSVLFYEQEYLLPRRKKPFSSIMMIYIQHIVPKSLLHHVATSSFSRSRFLGALKAIRLVTIRLAVVPKVLLALALSLVNVFLFDMSVARSS